MTQQQRLQNSCNWSSSRESTFLDCKKKYWYTYYGAWEGWPLYYNDPRGKQLDPLSAHLYMLKNMQTMPIYVGSVVHKVIEHILQSFSSHKEKKLPPTPSILAEGQKLFLQGIDESSKSLWKKSPKKYTHLLEHYYGYPLPEEQIKVALDKVRTCLENWASSPCIQSIALDPRASWTGIERSLTFEVAPGVSAIVVFDFVLDWKKKDDQTVIIFDWKTGQESQKIETQLYAYALAAMRELKVPKESMIIVPFHLMEGPYGYRKIGAGQIETLQEGKLKEVEEKIVASSRSMLALHKVEYDASGKPSKPDPLLFPYTENRSQCTRCPFLEVCEKASYQECSLPELPTRLQLV